MTISKKMGFNEVYTKKVFSVFHCFGLLIITICLISYELTSSQSILCSTTSSTLISPSELTQTAATNISSAALLPSSSNVSTTSESAFSRSSFKEKRYDSIFYLKTHKTGSTTIASLLYDYIHRQKLTSIQYPSNIYISKPNINEATKRANAIVGHHFLFDNNVINSYLIKQPTLIMTSLRLPLQRRLSWFRQQNRNLESIEQCDDKKEMNRILNNFDNFTMIGSQWSEMIERSKRTLEIDDTDDVLNVFDFVFLKERMTESIECFCKQHGVRLCQNDNTVGEKNVASRNGCVVKVLLKQRLTELCKGAERDLLLYEAVNQRISTCQREVPAHCRCNA